MGEIKAFVSGLFFEIGELFFKSWVFCVLWNWFLPPVLGVNGITFVTAIGIGLLVSVVTAEAPSKEKYDQPWGMLLLNSFMRSLNALVALVIGAFVHFT